MKKRKERGKRDGGEMKAYFHVKLVCLFAMCGACGSSEYVLFFAYKNKTCEFLMHVLYFFP